MPTVDRIDAAADHAARPGRRAGRRQGRLRRRRPPAPRSRPPPTTPSGGSIERLPGDPVRVPRPHPAAARDATGPRPVDLACHGPVAVRDGRGGAAALARRRRARRSTADGGAVRALAYPALVGEPEPGDRVLLNVSALRDGPRHRRVRAGRRAARPAAAGPAGRRRRPATTGTWSRPATRRCRRSCSASTRRPRRTARDRWPTRTTSAGMPVVTADLHSALPAVLAGIRADRPDARVAYVMTDGGALPAWFSRTLDGLRRPAGRHGHRRAGVRRRPGGGQPCTAGCSPPGTCSARTSRSSRRARATSAPARRWGFSGVAVGEAVNAAAALGGRPVGALRISDADAAAPAPRRLAPQPHRVRPGRARPRRPGAARRAWRRRWRPGGRRQLAPLARAAPDRRGWPPTASTRRCGPRRCRCRRWAAASTPTTPTSWPRPPPAGTPPRLLSLAVELKISSEPASDDAPRPGAAASTQVGTLYSPRRLRSISAHLVAAIWASPLDRVGRVSAWTARIARGLASGASVGARRSWCPETTDRHMLAISRSTRSS